MTKRPSLCARRYPVALVLLMLCLLAPTLCAEPLPADVVAVVGGNSLTFDGFCIAAEQQARNDLRRSLSGPRSVLEQLIEELMVRQECKRLGIRVQQSDVDALWNRLDSELRVKSNGERTLDETIREKGFTQQEFLEQMWHQIRKERIAEHPQNLGRTLPKHQSTRTQQVGIVINTLRNKTNVKYGVPVIEPNSGEVVKPTPLPAGQVATVNGAPIMAAQFGRALVIRLPSNKVREFLDQECKTALMSMEGVRLTDDEFESEVDHLRKLWPLERQLQRQEVWRTVSFKDRFETQFNMNVADVRNSRYGRGLLGLVRRQRAKVTEEEVAEGYKLEKAGRYGAHILVSDIRISFAQKKTLLGDAGLRTRREALRLAQGIAQRQATGVPFEKIIGDINARRDGTFRAQRLRCYNTDRDRILYSQAKRMRNGDVSSPFETLSEVHVIRREGDRPAKSLEEVRPHVRQLLARRMARQWIEDRLHDTRYVRIRWPLHQRGDVKRTR